MKIDDFVTQMRLRIVEDAAAGYRNLFESTEAATDPYFASAFSLYKSLDSSQRIVLLEIVRQTCIDTTAGIFSLFDGSSVLENQANKFLLRCGDVELSGDLTDKFLEQIEVAAANRFKN
jgi:hypothetical protein